MVMAAPMTCSTRRTGPRAAPALMPAPGRWRPAATSRRPRSCRSPRTRGRSARSAPAGPPREGSARRAGRCLSSNLLRERVRGGRLARGRRGCRARRCAGRWRSRPGTRAGARCERPRSRGLAEGDGRGAGPRARRGLEVQQQCHGDRGGGECDDGASRERGERLRLQRAKRSWWTWESGTWRVRRLRRSASIMGRGPQM
jgi:hypothetical protein